MNRIKKLMRFEGWKTDRFGWWHPPGARSAFPFAEARHMWRLYRYPSIAGLLIALVCAGCISASRTTTSKTGDVTQTRILAVLQTVNGLDDTVGADGSSHTALANLTGDTAMAQVLGGLILQAMKTGAIAANTNLLGNTNFLATAGAK